MSFPARPPTRYFYSRPCGRGDPQYSTNFNAKNHFYSRPCGRGDVHFAVAPAVPIQFLLTPLREGRRRRLTFDLHILNFYSRPCGRGDVYGVSSSKLTMQFLLTPLREGRLGLYRWDEKSESISTHAPAGGAT